MAVAANIHWRVYAINDFTNMWGCIEFHSYGGGHLTTFTSFKLHSPHRGYTLPNDCVEVFLNRRSVIATKDKATASQRLACLLDTCPPECAADVAAWRWEIESVFGSK